MKELGRQVEFDFTLWMKKKRVEGEGEDIHEIKDINSCTSYRMISRLPAGCSRVSWTSRSTSARTFSFITWHAIACLLSRILSASLFSLAIFQWLVSNIEKHFEQTSGLFMLLEIASATSKSTNEVVVPLRPHDPLHGFFSSIWRIR